MQNISNNNYYSLVFILRVLENARTDFACSETLFIKSRSHRRGNTQPVKSEYLFLFLEVASSLCRTGVFRSSATKGMLNLTFLLRNISAGL